MFLGAFFDREYWKMSSHLKSLRRKYLLEVERYKNEWEKNIEEARLREEKKKIILEYGSYQNYIEEVMNFNESRLSLANLWMLYWERRREKLRKYYSLSREIYYIEALSSSKAHSGKYFNFDSFKWEMGLGLRLRLSFIKLTKAFLFVHKYNEYVGLKSFNRFYYTLFRFTKENSPQISIYDYVKNRDDFVKNAFKLSKVKLNFVLSISFRFKRILLNLFWNNV
jgi:hypothetical protein